MNTTTKLRIGIVATTLLASFALIGPVSADHIDVGTHQCNGVIADTNCWYYATDFSTNPPTPETRFYCAVWEGVTQRCAVGGGIVSDVYELIQ